MTPTPLDAAFIGMAGNPDDTTRRLRFFDRFVHSELFLLLDTEPDDDSLSPRILEPSDGPVILAFDREERLADVAGEAPFAALSGRSLVRLVNDRQLGICLNLGAPSETVIGPDEIAWLFNAIDISADIVSEAPVSVRAPRDVGESLIEVLSERLAAAAGLAGAAVLVEADYAEGGSGLLMAFSDTAEGAEETLASVVGEALAFAGAGEGRVDVLFSRGTADRLDRFRRVGILFDIPVPEPAVARAIPGGDPEKPPILR